MKTRFTRETGIRFYLRKYWGETTGHDRCTVNGYHNAKIYLRELNEVQDIIDLPRNYGLKEDDFPEQMWPQRCDHCGVESPANAVKQIFIVRKYDTPSGDLEPGSIFWNTWLPENFFWDNHKGPHLCVILPNGREWNIDSRASNCDMPDDRNHRCWIRHGDPLSGEITVDKNGTTCGAGGGSIWIDDYHGHLKNGHFT